MLLFPLIVSLWRSYLLPDRERRLEENSSAAVPRRARLRCWANAGLFVLGFHMACDGHGSSFSTDGECYWGSTPQSLCPRQTAAAALPLVNCGELTSPGTTLHQWGQLQWLHVLASHHAGRFWGAFDTIPQGVPGRMEPQLPMLGTDSLMHIWLDFPASLSCSLAPSLWPLGLTSK